MVAAYRSGRHFQQSSLTIIAASRGVGGIALFIVKASDVAEELLQNRDFVTGSRCFAANGINRNLVGIDLVDRLNDVIRVKCDDDDFLVYDFRIEDSGLFCFLADVIPDLVIERSDGRWRTHRFQNVGPAADARSDFGDTVIFDDIAARGFGRRASREQSAGKKKAAEQERFIFHGYRPLEGFS